MEAAHGGRALLAGDEYGTPYTTEFGKSYLIWEVLVLVASTALFAFYIDQRLRGKGAEWEVIYIAVVEVIIYVAHVMYPKAPGAVIVMASGKPVNWLRYAGWLVTTPIIIIHMQSLSGVAKLNDQLIQMLVCNQGMILFGVTGAIGSGASRGVAFTFGCIAMFALFYRASQIYGKAFYTYPERAKGWLYASMLNFYIPWSCFPIFWLYGPEAGGQMGNGESVIAHSIADLSAKMAWGYITWHIHHVILHSVANDYEITVEEYCNARSFDVQFGHDAEWDPEDMDSPSAFALDMVFARRELEMNLEELNHGKLRPSQRSKRESTRKGKKGFDTGHQSPRRDSDASAAAANLDEVRLDLRANLASLSRSEMVANALENASARRSPAGGSPRGSFDAPRSSSFYNPGGRSPTPAANQQRTASGSGYAAFRMQSPAEQSPTDAASTAYVLRMQSDLEQKSKDIQELLDKVRNTPTA